jgi:hypothetical protein
MYHPKIGSKDMLLKFGAQLATALTRQRVLLRSKGRELWETGFLAPKDRCLNKNNSDFMKYLFGFLKHQIFILLIQLSTLVLFQIGKNIE